MTTEQRDTPSGIESLKLMGTGTAFHQELCEMIEASKMFGDFEWHDIEALSRHMQAYEASAGTTLFHEGETGDYLCLVIEGKVEIYKEDRNAQEKIVAVITAGKTLGEMAIVDGEPRSATAVMAEPTILAILTRTSFQRIAAEKPALATKIMLKIARLLSQRLRQTSGLLVDFLEG